MKVKTGPRLINGVMYTLIDIKRVVELLIENRIMDKPKKNHIITEQRKASAWLSHNYYVNRVHGTSCWNYADVMHAINQYKNNLEEEINNAE